MFVVSGCDSDGEGGHLNGQPNALNDHHHHQYQSRANLRQEVRHNDRDGASLGRVSDAGPCCLMAGSSPGDWDGELLRFNECHAPFFEAEIDAFNL